MRVLGLLFCSLLIQEKIIETISWEHFCFDWIKNCFIALYTFALNSWSKVHFLDTSGGDKVPTKPTFRIHFPITSFTREYMPTILMNVDKGILITHRTQMRYDFMRPYLQVTEFLVQLAQLIPDEKCSDCDGESLWGEDGFVEADGVGEGRFVWDGLVVAHFWDRILWDCYFEFMFDKGFYLWSFWCLIYFI